jgi:hypothetical protein
MCYGENGTVKFFETLADNVFRHTEEEEEEEEPDYIAHYHLEM